MGGRAAPCMNGPMVGPFQGMCGDVIVCVGLEGPRARTGTYTIDTIGRVWVAARVVYHEYSHCSPSRKGKKNLIRCGSLPGRERRVKSACPILSCPASAQLAYFPERKTLLAPPCPVLPCISH